MKSIFLRLNTVFAEPQVSGQNSNQEKQFFRLSNANKRGVNFLRK